MTNVAAVNKMFKEQLDSLAAIPAILGSGISQADSLKFINYYRASLAPDSIRSIWINKEILDFINQHFPDIPFSGIRVYLAKYQNGVGRCYPGSPDAPPDQQSVILALTTDDGVGVHQDIYNAYFDYGNPCPPSCNGDIGIK